MPKHRVGSLRKSDLRVLAIAFGFADVEAFEKFITAQQKKAEARYNNVDQLKRNLGY